MFFDDVDLIERKQTILKQLPATPETGWRPPTSYPSLNGVVSVGFDWEVKEIDLDRGPGWSRGKSHIVGGALEILYRNGTSVCEYRPIRHEVEPEYNLDTEQTFRFWRDVLRLDCPKFGTNLPYDHGNAVYEGFDVKGELHDIQFAEAIIDDTSEVALDIQGEKYLGRGKESNLLYEWCADAFGGNPTGIQRANIYRCSPRLVGPYAMADAWMPRAILAKQWSIMAAANQLQLYRMECDLIPLFTKMRMRGVRVNVAKAEEMIVKINPILKGLYDRIHYEFGVRIESTTGGDIKTLFKALEIKTPMTKGSDKYPDGQMSITKDFLNVLDHPISEIILEIRELTTLRNTFLQSYIVNGHTNGIIHGQFHQLRNDEGGTKVGRLSSSDPNLQNIPSRTELGKEIRKCFVPFEGHACWLKGDFSQLQYRALAHYAVGMGANELRAQYNNDPDADYHILVQEMILKRAAHLKLIQEAHGDLKKWRRPIKNVNFSQVMGGGEATIKRYLPGMSGAERKEFMTSYHGSAPYVKATMQAFSQEAQDVGYITSMLGRRFSFNLWEPIKVNYDDRDIPLPYEWAIKKYGSQIKRAMTHKSVAVRLQGFEGDTIKAGFHRAMREGIFDVIGEPTLTVHDEGDWSVKEQTQEQADGFNELKHIMETTLPCKVPIRFDLACGATWGDID